MCSLVFRTQQTMMVPASLGSILRGWFANFQLLWGLLLMAPSGSLLLSIALGSPLVLEQHAIRTGRVWVAVYKTPLSCLKVGWTPGTIPVLELCVGPSSGYTPLIIT